MVLGSRDLGGVGRRRQSEGEKADAAERTIGFEGLIYEPA